MGKSRRVAVTAVAEAMSYGPIGYTKSLIAGFVLGNVAFLILVAPTNAGSGLDKLPTLLASASVGVVLFLLVAAATNYLIGRRIRHELKLERAAAKRGARYCLAPPIDHPSLRKADGGDVSANAKATAKRPAAAASTVAARS